jgi:enterochelin esterase-like enzyme
LGCAEALTGGKLRFVRPDLIGRPGSDIGRTDMKKTKYFELCTTAILLAAFALANSASAQPRAQGPQVSSPEVIDRKITFRILAPKAEAVRLAGGDIPGVGQGREMAKNSEGVWEATLENVAPGYYRYNFNVDGVPVIDPRNPSTSESNANVWSMVGVPGAEFMETRNVPRGAISEVTYYSSSLQRFRRMHIYTPPGYEGGGGKFPVFYLLHGASDSDDSWSSVGRAGFILDNLIADGKAKPMLVVMPAGHTGPFRFGGARLAVDDFSRDFMEDIVPHVEKNYRILAERKSRALAGLSMGGGQTLNIGIPNLDRFGYLGVFSSGVFGITGGGAGGQQGPSFEERHREKLTSEELKSGLQLFWFATGKDDFLVETSRATVEMFKRNKFDVVYRETEGAHTWIVWREYLHEFAQKLFQ